jgi:hypothetical protein
MKQYKNTTNNTEHNKYKYTSKYKLLYMQQMVFIVLKILKLCKITYIYIVIAS